MLSCSGVPTINVVFCECVEVSCEPSAKLEGISQMRNVQFEESGLRVWRVYQLGHGKQIPRQSGVFHPYPSFRPLMELVSLACVASHQ